MSKTLSTLPPRATPLQPRKKAIVIGASSGIGAVLARQLAQEGYLLALIARRADRLKSICDEINKLYNEKRAIFYPLDVTQYNTVPGLLQKILAALGGLDLFIYNAGILLPVDRKSFNFEKDYQMTEVNYLSALAWLNPVAALFQNLKAGQIVGISSVAGDRGRVGNPAHHASKAALTTYLESLRNRLTRYGVHVLTVKPGYVVTELNPKAKTKGLLGAIKPDQAAANICQAIRRRKQNIYTPARWRWIMFIVRNIPSMLFRRMSF